MKQMIPSSDTKILRFQKLIGFLLGIIGLAILIWNAYSYISNSMNDKISLGFGIIMCFIGAALIKESRNPNPGL